MAQGGFGGTAGHEHDGIVRLPEAGSGHLFDGVFRAGARSAILSGDLIDQRSDQCCQMGSDRTRGRRVLVKRQLIDNQQSRVFARKFWILPTKFPNNWSRFAGLEMWKNERIMVGSGG